MKQTYLSRRDWLKGVTALGLAASGSSGLTASSEAQTGNGSP